jgi:hypothetical protein
MRPYGSRIAPRQGKRKASSSFLKKRTKKLLTIQGSNLIGWFLHECWPKFAKVSCFFFFKKAVLSYLLLLRRRFLRMSRRRGGFRGRWRHGHVRRRGRCGGRPFRGGGDRRVAAATGQKSGAADQ